MFPEQNDSPDHPQDFQFLADAIPQLVWTTKPDGNHSYYNQRWYDYTGLDFEQTRDQGWRQVIHPEDYPQTLQVWQDSLHSGSPYQIQYRLRCHDGNYRWFLGRALPQKDSEGRVLKWYGTCTDIEDQKQAQHLLQESKQREQEALAEAQRQKDRLEHFFRQAPAAICVLDGPELVFELVNPAFGKLYPGRELVGKSVKEALPEIAEGPFYPVLQRVYQTGEIFEGKEVLFPMTRYPGGPLEDIYFNFIYQARLNEQGKVDGILAFGYEVTQQALARQQREQSEKALQLLNQELVALNEELQAANEELSGANRELARLNSDLDQTNQDLDNFVYTASHDLKAPILNIEGLLKVLEKKLDGPIFQQEKVRQIYELLYHSVDRFKATIADLTQVARINKEEAQDVASISLKEVLEDVLLDLSPQIEEADANLKRQLHGCKVQFSRKNLKSILYNLVSNTIKYRSPDRRLQVLITCHIQANYQVLTVKDNGLGIDMRQEDKILALFKRLHNHVEGTGIGLYIVKKMIENAGGKIEVESQVGVGSIFRVYFKR